MKRLFQLILIILITTFSTSNSFAMGKIKAVQGIGVFFKTKVCDDLMVIEVHYKLIYMILYNEKN